MTVPIRSANLGVFPLPPNLTMRFGLNTFLYASPFTNESVSMFKKLKKWGFDTVEIAIEDPSHVDPAVLKAAAAKAGLAIGSICAAMGPGRDFRGSAADQKNAQKYLTALVDQAAAMGCPRIIGPLYSVVGLIGSHDDKTKAAHFKLVVKNLKQLAKHAEKKGVLLCVEPLNRFETDFLNTCDQGLQASLKAVNAKNVKLHLDTFHMNIEEKNQAAAIIKCRQARSATSTPAAPTAASPAAIPRLEADRGRAQEDRLQAGRRHRVLHHRREGHRPRRRHLAQDGAQPRRYPGEGPEEHAPPLRPRQVTLPS